MESESLLIFFALIRSSLRDTTLSESWRALCSDELIDELKTIAKRHDLSHLLALGLKKNSLTANGGGLDKIIFKAVHRSERQRYELDQLCSALETAEIPFIPLKGSVLRCFYPEPWMRTSCDIDVLVHREDTERAIACLESKLGYTKKESGTHDILLKSPSGPNVELHFDLLEEGRAQNAFETLSRVWEHSAPLEGRSFHMEMSDEFFYFYHIAHMAKHFENGGCGIRPFIDLWILDHIDSANVAARDELLQKGGLLQFANAARTLSRVWLEGETADSLSAEMQEFILRGGVYGTIENRVAIQQKKRGGIFGYFFSRVFIPYDRLKRHYPILEKHRYLTPIMQVRRWFMLLRPDIAGRTRAELATNTKLDGQTAAKMKQFLDDIGLL